jgi:hypothetical protein
MARTTSSDPAKPVAPGVVSTNAALPTDAVNIDSGTAGSDQSLAGTTSTTADAQVAATTTGVDASAGAGEADAQIGGAEDTGEITIYPLRSYLDGKEVRRAGGKGYKSPKHDAVSLIAAGLATDKKAKL